MVVLGSDFSCQRPLAGDPLFPMLFVLVMEVLNTLILQVNQEGLF
jgi:hypothetical protein